MIKIYDEQRMPGQGSVDWVNAVLEGVPFLVTEIPTNLRDAGRTVKLRCVNNSHKFTVTAQWIEDPASEVVAKILEHAGVVK